MPLLVKKSTTKLATDEDNKTIETISHVNFFCGLLIFACPKEACFETKFAFCISNTVAV
jgi:hypothetical protein